MKGGGGIKKIVPLRGRKFLLEDVPQFFHHLIWADGDEAAICLQKFIQDVWQERQRVGRNLKQALFHCTCNRLGKDGAQGPAGGMQCHCSVAVGHWSLALTEAGCQGSVGHPLAKLQGTRLQGGGVRLPTSFYLFLHSLITVMFLTLSPEFPR